MPVVNQQMWVTPTPPLPAPVNVAGLWSVYNYDPVGYPGGNAFVADNGDNILVFTGIPPYPPNWSYLTDGEANQPIPPFLLDALYNQTQTNNVIGYPAVAQVLTNVVNVPTAITLGGMVRAAVHAANFNGGVTLNVDFTVATGDASGDVANKAIAALSFNSTFTAFAQLDDSDANTLRMTFLTAAVNDLTALLTIAPAPASTVVGLVTSLSTITAAGQADQRPTVQVTTPMVVTGVGAGIYYYTGQSNGYAYYNLPGQGSDPGVYSIADNGDDHFTISGNGTVLNTADTGSVAFPSQASWTGSTVTAGTGSGQIEFDGTKQCLQSESNVGGQPGQTFYWYGAILDLGITGVIFEVTDNGLTTTGAVSFRSVAGVVYASVFSGAALNTKIKTVPDNLPHLWEIRIDTTAAAGNQVVLKMDGVTTGVTAPISTNLASLTLATGKLNIGSRNRASDFMSMSMKTMQEFTVAQDTPTETSWTNYNIYVNAL